jgi:hypothetical protein
MTPTPKNKPEPGLLGAGLCVLLIVVAGVGVVVYLLLASGG